ncbi:MAG TPA: zf-HC2 domain-containing protein [Planctomycetota bacterium]|nr:zf-HC2 domain-containing protein [Planctomycetota bacterium]
MTCSDAREALDALLDGELDAAEEAGLHVHLEVCADCEAELKSLQSWHRTLSGALAGGDIAPPAEARRRAADAAAPSLGRRRIPAGRLAALIAIGLSVGIVASAVGVSRASEVRIARVVERMTEQESRDLRLRAANAEIEHDLADARRAVAGRGDEDPAARAVAVASTNITRRLDEETPETQKSAGERVSITREAEGGTVSVVQFEDGRIRVQTPAERVEARNMEELLSRHGDVCRRYSIGGSDGFLKVADSSAGADWKGRLDLLLRGGAWDENLQWEAFRGWAAARIGDPKEIERRLRVHQERCRATAEMPAPEPAVDVEAIAKKVKALTRTELAQTQARLEADMKRLEERLKAVAELRTRAKGLKIFAEDVGRE